ncbi:MAG: AI-2E family transporter [Candidatus Margulisbacteria bacterium]|jgi:predicted PurR-regulated permease PerM|nr:AI-2E family transporter [Candidatus Margulisiibacteriota bacterium]
MAVNYPQLSILAWLRRLFEFIAAHKYWVALAVLCLAARVLAPTTFWIGAVAFFLYLLMHPLTEYLYSKIHSRRLAALASIILLTAALLFIISLVVPALIMQTFELLKNSQNINAQIGLLTAELQNKFQQFQELLPAQAQSSIHESISQYLVLWSNNILGFFKDIVNSLSRTITSVLQFLVAYVLLIYMLFDTKPVEKFKASLLREASNKEKKILTMMYKIITGYFVGQLLLSLISSLVVWIFYLLIGLKFPLLLALWNGFMQFIPFFGPVLAALPAVLVTFPDHLYLVLPIVIFFCIMQAILANILAPQILSKSTRLSPLVVFLVMLLGAEIWGIWGMIFSLPVASILIMCWRMYIGHKFARAKIFAGRKELMPVSRRKPNLSNY